MSAPMPAPSRTRFKKYVGVYLGIIFFIVAFGLGFLTGQTLFIKKQTTGEDGNVSIAKVLNLNRALNNSDSVDFEQFWEVWDRIKEKYVKDDVSETDLFYGAIEGMVYALGDPYSMYMTPVVADEFAKDLSGELEGIGAEIGIKNGQIVVVSPLADSPAEKAGLRAGDKILAIDSTSTYGLDVNTAVSYIRGEAGSEVLLTISRDGLTDAFEIKITRQKINVPSIMFSWKDNNIAYIRILQFNEDTENLFAKYADTAAKGGAKGIVLDVRNNPGGFLDAAISMASEWVTDGVIVSEKSENGNLDYEHLTSGKHRLNGIHTVVLVNGGSASASEIVAGALQDHEQAIVLGEQTYGKGSVQDFETFSDGSALKLTVAEWYTPNGKNINQDGITPDIEFVEDWDNEAVGEDQALDKAIELINGSIWPPEIDATTTIE
jgi:carboxyl-terminal processing protease